MIKIYFLKSVMLFFLTTLIFSLTITYLHGQNNHRVTGTITDYANNNVISGVTIRVEGTSIGTNSDQNGKYSLNADPNATLLVEFIGYEKQSVKVNNRSVINLTLLQSTENVDEVIVVAYGQQKKISITGAVSSVTGDELRQSSSASLANSLAGRLSGLTSIQSGGGQPGVDDATMYLRGAATTNGQNPLILIDGVPRDNIRTLDASEVESVTTLKDASATAVFGVRGANGVILITTKRGQSGKTEMNASWDQSYSSFTRQPERLTSLEYIDLRNQASLNDKIELPFSPDTRAKFENPLLGLDPNDPDYAFKAKVREYIYPNHDYYREFIKEFTPQSRTNVSARGGTDKVLFFVNTSYLHQGGNLNTLDKSVLGYDPSPKLDRYSFRANLDYNISKNFKTFLNLGSYIEQVNMPSAAVYPGSNPSWMMRDIFFQAQSILPITPGPVTIDGFGVEPGLTVDPGYLDRSAYEVMNKQGYRNSMRSNMNASFGMDWNLSSLLDGLSAKGMISYDAYASATTQGSKKEPLYFAVVNYDTDELSYTVFRPDEERISFNKGVDSRYNINLQGSLNFVKQYGKHGVSGMFLAQRDYWESTGGEIPFNVLGVAARATYAYDERYLSEVNLGYNGSEQFAPNNRFGFFPAVSLGWVVSNEAFFNKDSFLSLLKFRGSYGRVGNDKIGGGRFLYQSDITLGGGPLGSISQGRGINQGLLGNPNIRWEIADKRNIAVDLQFFKSLNVSFDYYVEKRSDILIERGTVPQFQGVPLNNIPKVNMGMVDNRGYEIELSYRKQINNSLIFRTNGNVGFNKNIVKFLDEPKRDDSYMMSYGRTGLPLNQSIGYKIDYANGNGYFNSQEELDEYLSHTTYGFGTPRVGDFKYKDLNEDGVVDNKDIVPIKYTSIPGLIYGLNLGASYRKFDFSIFFQGVGRYSSNFAEQGVYENTKQGTYFGYHKQAWTEERYQNGEEITYPALSTQNNTNHTANDFFVMNRSFVRLKNIELAYTFSENYLQSIGLKSLRVYVGAQNLYTWTKFAMSHHDPEYNDALGYPISKMYNFGLNLSF
ncbi:SusC/RagA family TonB-linked outer membrane protein [Sphingobacterium hungaricum]